MFFIFEERERERENGQVVVTITLSLFFFLCFFFESFVMWGLSFKDKCLGLCLCSLLLSKQKRELKQSVCEFSEREICTKKERERERERKKNVNVL